MSAGATSAGSCSSGWPGAPASRGGPYAVALTTTAGNITVAFAVLSYAGTLQLTVVADADTCPDLDDLAALLHDALDDLVRRSPGRRPRDTTTP